jgi:hypothetical protein
VGDAAGEAATDGAGLGADEPADADTDAGADGAAFVRCALTVVRLGGRIATAGAAATAIAAGLSAQGLAPAAPHPATVVRELATLPADDGPRENTP